MNNFWIKSKVYILIYFPISSLFQAVVPAGFHTSAASRDIEQAAKFIGAGAATVGCAGK